MTFTTTALTLLMLISATNGQQAEVVQTTLGPVQGLRQTVMGKDYDVYWGIPFAKPPLGDLRFKRPEPAEPWNGTLSADTKPNSCYQSIDTAFDKFPGVDMWNPNTHRSEDCLYLNVWVPRAFGSTPPKTTMVWIYGGGFFAGTSTLDVYNGAKLAVTENVIVASMNYRLGPLGFLYTGTIDAPGNQGLLDQALALKWIYDNIVSFKGQQNSITIFGESAGAVSVGFHLMSNVSQNYFTRAIMESGAPTADWGMMSHTQATTRAQRLSDMFGCPLNSISNMVQCLRQIDVDNMTIAQWGLVTPGIFFELPFAPVVDDHFILEEPRVLMANGTIKDTQLLIGVNKDEGMYWLLYGFPSLFPLNNSGNISDTEFKGLLHALTFNADEKVDKAFLYEYVDSIVPADRDPYRHVADDISGDTLFVCPTVAFAESFTSLKGQRDVYLYSFEHDLSNNPWPDWTGVMHGYEIDAVFGLPQEFNYTQQDVDVAARVTGYWSRFAMTGNPNNGSDVLWPKLTSQEAGYLKIREEGDSAGKGMRYRQCSFLSTLLPLIQEGTTPMCSADHTTTTTTTASTNTSATSVSTNTSTTSVPTTSIPSIASTNTSVTSASTTTLPTTASGNTSATSASSTTLPTTASGNTSATSASTATLPTTASSNTSATSASTITLPTTASSNTSATSASTITLPTTASGNTSATSASTTTLPTTASTNTSASTTTIPSTASTNSSATSASNTTLPSTASSNTSATSAPTTTASPTSASPTAASTTPSTTTAALPTASSAAVSTTTPNTTLSATTSPSSTASATTVSSSTAASPTASSPIASPTTPSAITLTIPSTNFSSTSASANAPSTTASTNTTVP